MNVLAIDAGNTRIKWGVHDGQHWRRKSWLATVHAARLKKLLAGMPPPDMIVIANVAGGALRERLRRALPERPAPCWLKSTRALCGVKNSYTNPAQLGCDRWAALIGARRLHAGALVVVNAGTALTVDALTDEGVFVGGLILPGAELMHRALARDTAALGMRRGRFSFFPASTGDAIASGAVNALAGAIERMAHFLAQAGQPAPTCVLSGGGAALIAPHLNLEVELVDNLVLEGLVVIAHEAS